MNPASTEDDVARGRAAGRGGTYSPAPERVARRDRRPVRPLHQRRVRRAQVAEVLRDDQPRERGDARGRRRGRGEADVDAAVDGGEGRAAQVGAASKPQERAKYLYRIARRIQERARELAIIETMDGGKPIKESRDVDVPLVAQHFFYHAGWCDKLKYAFPGRDAEARRRVRADHPVELPAAHGGVEARSRPRVRQHVRAQARGNDATDGAASRRDLRRDRVAAGRREHRSRRGRLSIKARTRHRPDLERLEPRTLLAADPMISEFQAINTSTIQDDDGDFSDWIELRNPDVEEINLDGWYLTDDATELDKWKLPAVKLTGGQELLVFASGKDRDDPGGTLHTNFRLAGDGEFLGLVKPDGVTIAQDFGDESPARATFLGPTAAR